MLDNVVLSSLHIRKKWDGHGWNAFDNRSAQSGLTRGLDNNKNKMEHNQT